MELNAIPAYDKTDNPTGCCPRFHPENWDGVELHFDNKPFVRASTISLFHIPLNMGSVFSKTWAAIEGSHAATGGFLVLSHDTSAWHAEHLFAVDKEVPGVDMVKLSGDFVTRVFEGPYSDVRFWCDTMAKEVADKGKKVGNLYFFFTTCPKCAKVYGKNYVVGIARVE